MDFILYIIGIFILYNSTIFIEYKNEYDKILVDDPEFPVNLIPVEKISYKIIVPKNYSAIYSQEYESHEYFSNHRHIIFRDF